MRWFNWLGLAMILVGSALLMLIIGSIE